MGIGSDGEAAAVLALPSTGQFPALSTCAVAALQQRRGLRAPVAASLHESQQKMALMGARALLRAGGAERALSFAPWLGKWHGLLVSPVQHSNSNPKPFGFWQTGKDFVIFWIKIRPARDCRGFVTWALLCRFVGTPFNPRTGLVLLGDGGGGCAGAVQTCTGSSRSPAPAPGEREMQLLQRVKISCWRGTGSVLVLASSSWSCLQRKSASGLRGEDRSVPVLHTRLGDRLSRGPGRMPMGWPTGTLPQGWLGPCIPNPVQIHLLQRAAEQSPGWRQPEFPTWGVSVGDAESGAVPRCLAERPWRARSSVGARGWGEERRQGWLGLPLPALLR